MPNLTPLPLLYCVARDVALKTYLLDHDQGEFPRYDLLHNPQRGVSRLLSGKLCTVYQGEFNITLSIQLKTFSKAPSRLRAASPLESRRQLVLGSLSS